MAIGQPSFIRNDFSWFLVSHKTFHSYLFTFAMQKWKNWPTMLLHFDIFAEWCIHAGHQELSASRCNKWITAHSTARWDLGLHFIFLNEINWIHSLDINGIQSFKQHFPFYAPYSHWIPDTKRQNNNSKPRRQQNSDMLFVV